MRSFLTALILSGALLSVEHSVTDKHTASHTMQSGPAQSATSVPPPVSGQLTFLYFNDLDKAVAFYAKVLATKPTLDLDWIKIYPLSPSSSIGLVNGTRGAHRPSADKPVMVSLVVDSPDKVDQWYARLKALGVKVEKPPETGDLVRAFAFDDPEGYTLEVFAWKKR